VLTLRVPSPGLCRRPGGRDVARYAWRARERAQYALAGAAARHAVSGAPAARVRASPPLRSRAKSEWNRIVCVCVCVCVCVRGKRRGAWQAVADSPRPVAAQSRSAAAADRGTSDGGAEAEPPLLLMRGSGAARKSGSGAACKGRGLCRSARQSRVLCASSFSGHAEHNTDIRRGAASHRSNHLVK
jgi:hypothetical protein